MFTFVLVAKLQGTGCGYTNTERLFCNRITVFTRGNLERADTVDSENTYLGFPLIKLIKLMVFDINHHILHIFIFDIYHIFEHSAFRFSAEKCVIAEKSLKVVAQGVTQGSCSCVRWPSFQILKVEPVGIMFILYFHIYSQMDYKTGSALRQDSLWLLSGCAVTLSFSVRATPQLSRPTLKYQRWQSSG